MEELTIAALRERMESGALTVRGAVDAYLRRIERLDAAGPILNSVIELNPEALDLADQLDAERRAGRLRGPLHGVPVLLKDNVGTADRMTTTAGSLALEGCVPARDAFLVRRLRQAGALLLGKTNLSEWANFRSSRSTSGWSSRGGQTRNPYALDRNPCGSSSGSAVAVAASLCAAAVGTETDGSIVGPSHMNGVVGIKPTVGLISRTGVVPIAHSQDTAGSMARCVADAAILLGAMTGVDVDDEATLASADQAHRDYTAFLDAGALRGARIGVARGFGGFHERVDAVFEAALAALRAAGSELVDPAEIDTRGQFDDAEFEVLLYEFKADLNAYLACLPPTAGPRTLAALIDFNEAHRERTMPYFGQELFLRAQEKGPLTDEAYVDARERCRRLARDAGIDATLARHRLDAIVAPSGGPASVTDLVNGDHFLGGSSSPAAAAGYPSITVPAGQVFGLPVGVSFIGGAYQEPRLIALAHAFERATQARRPPRYLPAADLSA